MLRKMPFTIVALILTLMWYANLFVLLLAIWHPEYMGMHPTPIQYAAMWLADWYGYDQAMARYLGGWALLLTGLVAGVLLHVGPWLDRRRAEKLERGAP